MAVLETAHRSTPEAPVFDESVGFALIADLLAKGRKADAVAFHQLYGTFDPKFRTRHMEIGKHLLKYGMKTRALEHFEKAILLNPDDAEAAEHAKTLRQEAKSR